MSTANTSALKVSDLDFFSIRNNLKEFLRSQDTFTDYDFEGSGMAVLLDVLAYNTYYNSFYLNMVANESFLDTAQMRQNVLSHAKMINYVPTSMRASTARINVIVTPSPNELRTLNVITLDKYTRLTGIDSNSIPHPFVTMDSISAYKESGKFNFANVAIKQGEVMTQQYYCGSNTASRKFELPSSNVDTSTILVSVQESASNTFIREYKHSEDITLIGANSYVYFVEENENEKWTVYFGDGVLGYRPKDGNIVQVTYLDTNGAMANDVNQFAFVSPVAGLYKDSLVITTVQKSFGGTDKEDIDKIRFRAPQYYSTQNRAVTVDDYESIITKNYTNIDAVSVWGGEDNNPPVYGKVYMSLKTKGFYTLTEAEKDNIKNDLIKNSNVVTVTPEIVDPDFMFLIIKGTVTYNPNLTTKSSQQILGLVKSAITQYAEDELNTFKSTFKRVKLQNYIEDCDPSITSSDIEVIAQKRVDLILQQRVRYDVNFGTSLQRSDYVNNKYYTFPTMSVYDSSLALQNILIEDVPNSNTGISSINVTRAGYGFLEAPSVVITGDGVGASAYAVLSGDRVNRVVVTNKGRNYTKAQVTLVGGGGQEAAATAILEENLGTLQSYYIRTNGDKVIIDLNAGFINYGTGESIIYGIAPQTSANNPFYMDGVMTFNALPSSQIITPKRNRILTIDVNNGQSIQINMVAQAE
jgi:hypothetical protein